MNPDTARNGVRMETDSWNCPHRLHTGRLVVYCSYRDLNLYPYLQAVLALFSWIAQMKYNINHVRPLPSSGLSASPPASNEVRGAVRCRDSDPPFLIEYTVHRPLNVFVIDPERLPHSTLVKSPSCPWAWPAPHCP